ncbi:MAG TPA: RluA family pseudouridine synthase [Vicinamibacterales bacterium]|nr:RluA family pseudouridine synthase [Vicinamibacterales bacterium]
MSLPIRTLTADRGDAGRRLDLVLRRHLTDVSAATRTRVQAWIESGRVTVNGAAVHRVAARTAFGDIVAITLPDAAEPSAMAAENIALDVLYEDEHLLALDKPAGMVVHPTYKHATGTIMNALLWRARGWPAGQRPSLAGRLDKDTSGIVLVAKTAAVHAALQRTLARTGRPSADRTGSEKVYLAVVHGRVNVARGTIDLRLARDRGDRRRVVASDTVGAPSVTHFERLARTVGPGPGVSVLRCRLMTGRTHQIRVHLAARGWPIVGDPVYGEPRWRQIVDPALAATLPAFPRQALHAWRLAFVHPITGQRLDVEAAVPADIVRLLTDAGVRTGWR